MTVKFGEAIEALKQGKRIRRHFWNPEKKFIFKQVPANIDSDIVQKMQSLPQTVKDYFHWTFNDENEQIQSIHYSNQIALVGLSNMITGYAPTPEDVLAEDWVILD